MLSGLENQVFEYIESNRDPLLNFLRKIVRIDTQTPPGLNYDILCEFLADKYHGLGYERALSPRFQNLLLFFHYLTP